MPAYTGPTVRKTVVVRLWDNDTRTFSHVSVDLEFKINLIAEDMGRKARRNKSGVTRAMNGAITCSLSHTDTVKRKTPQDAS